MLEKTNRAPNDLAEHIFEQAIERAAILSRHLTRRIGTRYFPTLPHSCKLFAPEWGDRVHQNMASEAEVHRLPGVIFVVFSDISNLDPSLFKSCLFFCYRLVHLII